MRKSLISWSGGKDSCYATMLAIANGYTPVALLNMMNENDIFSRSHAIPKAVLKAQAAQLGLPITNIPATWAEYEEKFIGALKEIVANHKIDAGIFGDIDVLPNRQWEEKVCAAAGIEAYLPLWQMDRRALVFAMIDTGIEAYIVSCNQQLGSYFLGQKITKQLVVEIEAAGADACGENGEYHTLVVNCPLFNSSIDIGFGEIQRHDNYWFIQHYLKEEVYAAT